MRPTHSLDTHSLARHALTTLPDSTRARKRLLTAVVRALPRDDATRLTAQALLKHLEQEEQLQSEWAQDRARADASGQGGYDLRRLHRCARRAAPPRRIRTVGMAADAVPRRFFLVEYAGVPVRFMGPHGQVERVRAKLATWFRTEAEAILRTREAGLDLNRCAILNLHEQGVAAPGPQAAGTPRKP